MTNWSWEFMVVVSIVIGLLLALVVMESGSKKKAGNSSTLKGIELSKGEIKLGKRSVLKVEQNVNQSSASGRSQSKVTAQKSFVGPKRPQQNGQDSEEDYSDDELNSKILIEGGWIKRKTDLKYTLDPLKNGLVLLINNRFKAKQFKRVNPYYNAMERFGTDEDERKLKELFEENLGFEIEPEQDVAEEDLQDIIQKFVGKCKTGRYHSCFVIIMTHGTANDLLYMDDKALTTINLFERIVYKFFIKNTENPTEGDRLLDQMPKIFIVEACRGGADPTNGTTGLKEDFQQSIHMFPNQKTFNHLKMNNAFVWQSACPYTEAYLHDENGSFFVQAIYSVVKENAHKYHLALLSYLVSKKVQEESDPKQMPCPQDFAFKKYKFPPFKKL